MKIIHPRRFLRDLIKRINVQLFVADGKKEGVFIEVGDNCILNDCSVANHGRNNRIIIGDECDIVGARFSFFGSNNIVCIGGG